MRRLWLTGKRRIVACTTQALPRLAVDRRRDPPSASETPPRTLLPSRRFCRSLGGGRFEFRFLNQERALDLPISWQDPGVDRAAHLWAMHLHYMEFLEDLGDRDFVHIVLDWIAANRPYRRAYWHASWNSYALSIRSVVWMQQLAARRDRFDAPAATAMHESLAEQLRFLEHNLELDILGNHLIKNIKALLWAGRYFSGPEADRWRGLGERLLLRELSEQVLADGMHYERSPSYHNQVFADLIDCWAAMAEADSGTRSVLAGAMAKMAQVTADMRHGDGLVPLFNDAGLSSAYTPAQCLRAYETATGVRVSPCSRIVMPQAGYWGLRCGDGLFVLDCGPIGPDFLVAHGHGDLLSFEWSVGGRRIIVDQGVFQYDPGANRDAARSTLKHNTVSITGAEQCDFFAAFRCGRRARPQPLAFEVTQEGFKFVGSHSGFDHLDGARHVRRFDVGGKRVVIDDTISYPADSRSATAGILLHPDCEVSLDGRTALIRSGSVRVRATFETRPLIERAVWWPDMGAENATHRLVLHFDGRTCHQSVLELLPESRLTG